MSEVERMLAAAMLDADAEDALWLHRLGWGRRAAAIMRLPDVLERARAHALAGRVSEMTESDIGALANPVGWQWVRALLDAAEMGDVDRFRLLEGYFEDGSADFRSRTLRTSAPGIQLSIDEDLLQAPVSGHFSFHNCAGAVRQLSAALELAGEYVPALLPRFATVVVPVDADAGQDQAATWTETPGVTYASLGRPPCDLLAALAHEEAHSILNSAESLGIQLPNPDGTMFVPWKLTHRRLPAVVHGIAAFGRAAAVRQRVVGVTRCPTCAQHLEAERQWVVDVVEGLRKGELGEEGNTLVPWAEEIVRTIDEAAPVSTRSEPRVLCGGDEPYKWRLLELDDRDACAALYTHLFGSVWSRRHTPFYSQDVAALPLAGAGVVQAIRTLANGPLAEVASQVVGSHVRVSALKVHRHRPGDRVGVHTDAEAPALVARAVIGITPGHRGDDGRLELLDHRERPVVGVGPALGTALVFAVGPESRHQVTQVVGPGPRFAAVVSYERVSA